MRPTEVEEYRQRARTNGVRPLTLVSLALLATGPVHQPPAPVVTGIEYQLVFNRTTAAARSLGVSMRFQASAAGPVELSLPAWTPGAYEISNYARRVSSLTAVQGAAALRWDKTDFDTWRVHVSAPGPVTVAFIFSADTLDNAMAWSRADFAFVNGTNVLLYPEGAGLDFPATLSVETEAGWDVATGLTSTGPRRYTEANFHDLVDMPLFIGRFDVDSALIGGVMNRIASYPAGALAGAARVLLWKQLSTMVPAMAKVFGETPWPNYTTLLVFDSAFGGGSALEHQNSHLGIYSPDFIGTPVLASITAHEIFHGWNVKRLRPSEMVPYRYDRPQPSPLLWVREGITDYYADLALVRGGVIDSALFLNVTQGKIDEVTATPPVALEDASLSTWIQPTDGTGTIYYAKGSLAGLLLDIMIRDASDNRASLDEVMRTLYRATVPAGRGFTTDEWWAAVNALAGRDLASAFAPRYIDGRESFPWARVAPLAGIRYIADSVSEPRLGVGTTTVEGREIVTNVTPGGPAALAGVLPGDELIRIGDLKFDPNFGPAFRARYRARSGSTVPLIVRRADAEISLTLVIRAELRVDGRLEFDRRPSLKAARIRHAILSGTTDRQ